MARPAGGTVAAGGTLLLVSLLIAGTMISIWDFFSAGSLGAALFSPPWVGHLGVRSRGRSALGVVLVSSLWFWLAGRGLSLGSELYMMWRYG